MKRRLGRSTGVDATIAADVSDAPDAAEVAFEELYRSSRDDVYSYAAGLLRDRSAAEEATATAFERAYRRRRQFDPKRGSGRAWLFGIARNAALDELRRRKRIAPVEGEHVFGSEPDPGDAAVRRQTVMAALETLSGREREVVALKFFAGLSGAEIAAVIGTSESNVGTLLHRTIEKLRKACDEAD
jgi:RNA polymerase sigma factor (sigma-70 family)